MRVDINFERRDLTSAQKIHPSPDTILEKPLHFPTPIPHQLRKYLIDGPFLNHTTYKTFEYRIH